MMGLPTHRAILEAVDGRARVRIEVGAQPAIGALLKGKTPEAAAALAPLIFNLCASAQEAAARIALGLPSEPDAGRRIAAEILREHALRCLKDWPEALGLEPDLAALAGLGRLAEGPESGALDRIEEAMFGPYGLSGIGDLKRWAAKGARAPARALDRVRRWPADWSYDPGHGPAALDPTLLRRVADDRRLRPMLDAEGPVLSVRMAARLVDAARMIEVLRGARPGPEAERLAPGVGAVEAARGRLVHRARLKDGLVAAYAVESPTDATLAEDGLLTRLLAAASRAPTTQRTEVARIALLAVDPCAPVTLELGGLGAGPDCLERSEAAHA